MPTSSRTATRTSSRLSPPITYINALDTDGDGYGDTDVTVAENIRFDVRYGEITFIIEDMDGYLPGDMNGTVPMTFRIVALGD